MTMNTKERAPGVVIGKVTANRDPEGLGRIQVSYPFLDQPEERWISLAAPMAGAGSGFFVMPEVHDEVVIAFHHGMWDDPVAIAMLWNPVQPPPTPDPRQRMWRSRNGHAVRMLDPEPAAGNRGALIIEDGHGNTIMLANGHLSITAVGRMSITALDLSLQGRVVRPVGGPI
jgi:uncharacterized protein involved in type VI secretion and phage assembly